MTTPFLTRRTVLNAGLAGATGATLARVARAAEHASSGGYRLRISLAGYSFRKYLGGGADKATMTVGAFIDYCAGLGLDAVEPTAYYIYDTTPAYLHGLKARAFRQGIEISGTAIGNDFCLPAGAKLDAELAAVRKWVDAAVAMGAPHIRVFAGRRHDSREADFEHMVAAMKKAVDYAASRGVFLGIENHGYLTGTADAVLRIVDAVPSPWFGINLDTGNFKDHGYDEIARCAPKALNCQVKTHIVHRGKKEEVDMARVFAILRKANYRGYVVLEYEDRPDPKAAVPGIIKRMQALGAGTA